MVLSNLPSQNISPTTVEWYLCDVGTLRPTNSFQVSLYSYVLKGYYLIVWIMQVSSFSSVHINKFH